MTRDRQLLVLVALLLVESSWVFLVFSALGLGVGESGAVLSWLGVLVLLTMGVVFQRWVTYQRFQEVSARIVGVAAGLAAIYAVVGLQNGDLGWPATLGRAFSGEVAGLRVFLTLLAALAIWWWGLHTAASGDYETRLGRAFRVALVALIVAAVANAATTASFAVVPVAAVVFCAALAGFAVANVQRPEVHGAAWARLLLIGGGGVLLAGLVVGLMAETALGGAVGGLLRLAGVAAEAILRVVFIPLEWLLQLLFAILNSIIGFITGGEGPQWPEFNDFGPPGDIEAGERGEGLPGWLVGLVKWGLVALFSGGAVVLLYRVLWFGRAREAVVEEGVRESVREEAERDDWSLMGLLLGNERQRARLEPYPLPVGDEPATRVRRAYVRLLNLAMERGKPRAPWETPLEYDPRLSDEFPGTPVPEVTQAFLRVRFGLMSPSAEEVASVEQAVERAGQRGTGPAAPEQGGDESSNEAPDDGQ